MHGGFGGGGGGACAAAKTSGLGYYDKSTTPEVEPTGRKAALVFGEWWALLTACVLASCLLSAPVARMGSRFRPYLLSQH